MKTFTVSLLGRKFRFESDLAPAEVDALAGRIAGEIERYSRQFPNADRLDVLFFCILDLAERLAALERGGARRRTADEAFRRRISKVVLLVEDELKKLTNAG